MTDLSDFGGGIDEAAVAADRRDDEQESLGVRCDVDGCDADVVGLDDGWEYDRGTVCQDCIDYQDRHGHWPDEDSEACAECRIDDGAIPHECPESSADHVLVGLDDECSLCGRRPELTVSEDGLWLPTPFVQAHRIIIRTPTKTVDSRLGEEARRRIHSGARAGDWDEGYLVGEGRTAEIRNDECLPENNDGVPHVGLLIAGTGEQRWFPVELLDGGRDE